MTTGQCKICSSSVGRVINKRLALGQSYRQIIEHVATLGFSVSKPTMIAHRRHITDMRTTVVEEARKHPLIKRVTTSEFLQTLVDIGAAKAADPAQADAITIDQSIRAAQVLEGRKEKQVDVLLVIARSLAPKPDLDMIEGEYKELTTHEVAIAG